MPLEPKPPVTDPAGPPSWMAPVIPVVPDHELLRRIGGGSYGDVWLARTTVGTWRAVKVVFRDRFTDARPYEREFNGMQKFEPLSRGNEAFVDILQIGRNDAEGYFYYVMELADDAAELQVESSELRVEGEAKGPQKPSTLNFQPSTYVPKTLSKVLLQRGRLPLGECLELGLTLNLGLAHLHRAGLIHRDIKPSNLIFVGGVPKLADIGLVIETAEARSYVGTEGFIPPEGPNSPQADLYSLGKVLYEAGMGKDRKDFPEPFTQLIDAPNSTQLLEFNAILLKACAANVKERYQSAEEMNADLALLQSGGSVRRQRKLAGQLRFVQRAGAVVTVIAALATGLYLWQARQTRIVRDLATEKSQLADEKTKLADQNRQIADEKTKLAVEKTSLAEANREQLVRLRIANGVRLMDEDDLSGALLWFAEALPLVTNKPTEEAIHRVRIQQALDHAPQLLGVMHHGYLAFGGAFGPDGRQIAMTTGTPALGYFLTLINAQSGNALWRLTNGYQSFHQVRFARDGQRLFVGTSANEGRLGGQEYSPSEQLAESRNTQTGELLFPSVRSNLFCSAFSPDDRWLAIALTNHVIQLLDASRGKLVAELKGHTNRVTMLAFSDDGGLLVSASLDQTARVWRLPSGEPVGQPLLHDQPVQFMALSAHGRFLATAAATNYLAPPLIQVWNVQTGEKIGSPIIEKSGTMALFFGPAGRDLLFTCGDTEIVRVWDVDAGVSLQRTLPTLNASSWAFSPDGRMLALGTDYGLVKVWNTEIWELLLPPFRHNDFLTAVHFSLDSKQLLTTSYDGTARVWSLRTPTDSARLELSANLPDAPAGKQRHRGRTGGPIPVYLADKALHLIDPERLTEIDVLRAQETNATLVTWSAGSSGRCWTVTERVEGATAKDTVALWAHEGQGWRRLTLPHPSEVWQVAFNADESRLFTFCGDSNIRVWRTSDGALERSIPVPQSLSCWNAMIFPDAFRLDCRDLPLLKGKILEDQRLQLFDLATGELTGSPFPLAKIRPAIRMRFSPDGSRLAFLSEDLQASIIDLKTGQLAVPQFKPGGSLADLDWSPDGKRLVTGGSDPEIKVWDASTGELIGAPLVGRSSARWSADGRFIATRTDDNRAPGWETLSGDNRARVWDASTSEAVTPFLRHSGYIRWVCITPGNRLITASDPNLLRAWDLKPTALPVAVIADYARFLSGRKLSAGGALLPLPAEEVVKLQRSLRTRAPQLFE